MARTWVMMIGLTLLLAATCPGDEAFIGPPEQGGGSGDPGATEGYRTAEPNPDPGYEVVGSEPVQEGEGEVTEVNPDGDSGVIDVKPDGDGEIVYVKPGIYYGGIYPLETDNRIYVLGPNSGSEGDGSPRDISSMAASMTAQDAYAWVLAQIPGEAMTSVGLPVGTDPGSYAPVDTSGPDLVQVRSTIGQALGAQTAVFTNAVPNLSSFSAQFDTARSQFYGQANEVLGTLPIPWSAQPVVEW